MARENLDFSDLSSEVQASIIKVAGDWALAITNRKFQSNNLKDISSETEFTSQLIQQFQSAKLTLTNILEE